MITENHVVGVLAASDRAIRVVEAPLRRRGRVGATVAALALAATLAPGAADAAQNLVANGSFEGANGLVGWKIGGQATDGYLPVAIAYGQASGYPTGAQGESVPADDATSDSPDVAGANGVYFVSDEANNLSLYQTVYLGAGSYEIGFDSYDTFNGASQPHDAVLTANIAGVGVADFALSTVTPGVWTTHNGVADITQSGDYLVAFTFNTPDTPLDPDPANPGGEYNAKDVVIDRAFIVADPAGGVPISAAPEPSAWALMLAGVGVVGLVTRRAKRRDGAALIVAG